MSEPEKYIPLENITVSGIFPGEFYPIWVNDWGQAEVNTKYELSMEGWLLAGETATGVINATYADSDYENDPDAPLFLARKSFVDSEVEYTREILSEFLPLKGGILLSPIYLTEDPDEFDLDAAVTVGWVETQANLYLQNEGGTAGAEQGGQQMTGPITLYSDLSSAYNDLDAIPLFYLNQVTSDTFSDALNEVTNQFIPLAGGTVTDHLTVPDPISDCHAANFKFLKDAIDRKVTEYFEEKISG